MKRVEAYFILNELWKDANEKQREAISIAQNDIEFVDMMPEEVANRLKGAMTNADYIRSMSDEELCDFILEKRENGTCFNDRCYVNDPNKGCDDCTMEWLKQPYKEEEA